MSALAWTLTTDESQELETLEAVVDTNLRGFHDTALALYAIRQKKLYRQHSETFEEYCRSRFSLEKSHVNRLMDTVPIMQALKESSPIGEVPKNEAQARELKRVPSEKVAEVWQKAVDTAPEGGVTAQHVRNTVRPYRGDLYPKPVEPVKKGFPSESHKRAAVELILKTREPRGTIAKFLGVHDSVVSNLIYLSVEVRSTLDEQREQAYITAARLIGKSEQEAKDFINSTSPETVRS